MLTPAQIEALRDRVTQISDPLTEYLLADIARRISQAGQLTSTAAYEVWRTQNLGMSQREIKKWMRDYLKLSHRDIRKLLAQSAEVGYNFDIKRCSMKYRITGSSLHGARGIIDGCISPILNLHIMLLALRE